MHDMNFTQACLFLRFLTLGLKIDLVQRKTLFFLGIFFFFKVNIFQERQEK